ncbi:MAG TPA: glycosyltransferase family 4 protein [Polyangiaceae bacterium]|nr:glycosyltransferase family 4 protein [Polyangiaceae bacterium]
MRRSRIRLLYVQPSPLFGGAERQAAEQASYLTDFGVDVTVMAGPGQPVVDWLRENHVAKVIRSPHFPGGGSSRLGWRRLILPFHFVNAGARVHAEILDVVRTTPVDVMLASLPIAWITATLVARRAGIPIAWRAGGYYINVAQAAGMWALSRFLRPDLLISNGKAVERTFHRLIPGPAAILPNGVDTRAFNPRAGDVSRYRPPSAGTVVGFAGRLASTKRPKDVIELAVRLGRSHPDTRVLIAGDGELRATCERLASERGASNVTFLGYVADMPSFYAACDVVVLPSRSEGSSNVIAEAMASGKAVVTSDIPPLREQVEPEVNGLVFPVGDVAALTRAVERLLADPARRRALAERALEAASQNTPRATAERLSWMLERLVAERDGKRARSAQEGRLENAGARASTGH